MGMACCCTIHLWYRTESRKHINWIFIVSFTFFSSLHICSIEFNTHGNRHCRYSRTWCHRVDFAQRTRISSVRSVHHRIRPIDFRCRRRVQLHLDLAEQPSSRAPCRSDSDRFHSKRDSPFHVSHHLARLDHQRVRQVHSIRGWRVYKIDHRSECQGQVSHGLHQLSDRNQS